MGVMECNRRDCSSIMCDTYIAGIGFVCSNCEKEFREHLERERINPSTEGEIFDALKAFMKTSPQSYKSISVDEFFKQYKK